MYHAVILNLGDSMKKLLLIVVVGMLTACGSGLFLFWHLCNLLRDSGLFCFKEGQWLNNHRNDITKKPSV